MNENILSNLMQIEEDHKIKILYACEAGSRAWGYSSMESDYDVRFIYIHPIQYYLSIDAIGTGKRQDVIERPIFNGLDLSGWELTKTLRLFRKSNPSLLEWLHSPIEYYQAYSTIQKMKEILPNFLSNKSCILHYLNTAKANYAKYQKGIMESNVKVILTIVRPILVANWIERFKKFPPLSFQHLVDNIISNNELKHVVQHLMEAKITGTPFKIDHEDILLNFVLKEINRISTFAKRMEQTNQNETEILNKLFRTTLEEVWS
jgi:uncharacterized protein